MYTIVVADDEEELRRAIIRKIDWESIGFQVVGEAENGIEALELVERMEPDLLLTDIRMPFVSGIELARQVREVRPTTQKTACASCPIRRSFSPSGAQCMYIRLPSAA